MSVAYQARRIFAEATRLDRSGIAWRFGLRCTAGVAIPLVASDALGRPDLGVPAAIGALVIGFASRQGVYRTRAAAMLAASAGMALSAFVAAVCGGNVIADVAISALWGFAFGVVASLGPAALTVGLNSLVALTLFGQFRFSPGEAALQGALVFAGGALQTVLLVAVWPLARRSAERGVLARAFRALADYAAHFADPVLRSPDPAALTAVAQTLSDPQPFARRGDLLAFEGLLSEAERLRGSLAALALDRYVLAAAGSAVAASAVVALGSAARTILLEIARGLERGAPPADVEDAWDELEDAVPRLERIASTRTVRDARALLGQLRAAWRTSAFPETALPESVAPRPGALAPAIVRDAWRTVRANLSLESAFARHGVRLAVTLALATLAAHLLPLERGYWIGLTAVLILRPDFTTTFSRGVARLLGTLLGAALASTVALLRPSTEAELALALAFAAAGYTVFNVNYAAYTVTVTAYVISLLAFGGLPEHRALLDRIEATLIGGALALAVYVAWPRWEHTVVPTKLGDLIDRQRAYSALVLGAIVAPDTRDDAALRAAQRAAWLARSNADASVERMLVEPAAPRLLGVRAALAVLAASRRLGIASLALGARLPPVRTAGYASLREFRDALDAALAALADALRAGTAPRPFPDLRDVQTRLERCAGVAGEAGAIPTVLNETDLMTDAANTIADALARAEAAG